MLRYRLIFGPLLIALVLGAAWFDGFAQGRAVPGFGACPPGVLVFPIVAMVSVLGARELARILKSKGVPASARVSAILALAGLTIVALVPESWRGTSGAGVVNFATGAVLVGSLAFYARHERVEGMVAAAGGALLAFAYLGLMMGFLVLLRREHSVWVLVWVLLTTKSCDIGAYFTGKLVGKRRLIPWLSPGKTWEGLIGGVVTSGVVGALGAWGLARIGVDDAGGVWLGLAAGALFGLVGQVGDLMVSLLKRDAGLKDAGGSLPGFGGVLDVVDSPALVGPVAFWWLRAVAGAG